MKYRNQTIQEISSLKKNWNQYGAEPLSEKVLSLADRIVSILPHEPFIAPTACNTIQFEWEFPDKDYLEFEIGDSDFVKIFRMFPNGTIDSFSVPVEDTDLLCRVLLDFIKPYRISQLIK